MQVWFKNKRAKFRQIQKQHQQQHFKNDTVTKPIENPTKIKGKGNESKIKTMQTNERDNLNCIKRIEANDTEIMKAILLFSIKYIENYLQKTFLTFT